MRKYLALALTALPLTGCGAVTVDMPEEKGAAIKAHHMTSDYILWEDCSVTYEHFEGETALAGLSEVKPATVKQALNQAAGQVMPWCAK